MSVGRKGRMEPEIVLSIFNVILGNAIAKVPVDLEGCFSRLSLPSSSVFNEGECETETHHFLFTKTKNAI